MSAEFKKTINSLDIISSLLIYSLFPLRHYLGHPLAVLGLQALFGLLEVTVFVFISGRLQVVVHSVGGAGCGCGYCIKMEVREKKKNKIKGGGNDVKRLFVKHLFNAHFYLVDLGPAVLPQYTQTQNTESKMG